MEDDVTRRNFLQSAVVTGVATTGSMAVAKGTKPKNQKSHEFVPRKQLGKTGKEIPILLVGGAQVFNTRYDKILHGAYKEGVEYLDTALEYAGGRSHKTIAPFIKQMKDRKKLWITSKVPHYSQKGTTKEYEVGLEECLSQLQTTYLDMFYMHGLDHEKYLDKEYLAMGEKMKKSGKIKLFGFSCHSGNVVELMNKAAKTSAIDSIMFRYDFTKYGDQKLNHAIDACKKSGIGLIAMKTQKSVPDHLDAVKKFKIKNFNLAQAKLKAVWADERIDAVVSHMKNVQQLQENIAAAKSKVQLTMDDLQHLWRYAAATSTYSCNGCSQICESRITENTKIADILRFLTYHESYGEHQKAQEFFQALEQQHRSIANVDFSEATKACPQGIDIDQRLKYACQVLSG